MALPAFTIFVAFTALAAFFSLLPPLLANAQSDPPSTPGAPGGEMVLFQEIPSVYAASRYEQNLAEAPSSVTIITASDIKKYGYRTLADILQSVRGFFTTYDRNYAYIGARGFGRPGDFNTRVLLLIDGHRVNDNIYDMAPIGTEFPLDLDLIDRVEIIRGPTSSIYGTNAFFGVIDVITRRGRDLKGAELSGEAGSFEAYKGRISYGNKYSNGIEMLLSGSYFESQGHDLFFKELGSPANKRGIAHDCDDDKAYGLFSKISFHDFTLESLYHSREKGIPTGAWGAVLNDARTRTIDDQYTLDLKFDHGFDNQLGLMARVYYDHRLYDGHYIYDYATSASPPNPVLNKDYGYGDWWGSEFQLTKKLFDRHKLILGLEYVDNRHAEQGNYDVNPYALYFHNDKDSQNYAFYIQDEYRIFRDVILNAGVRYDHFESFGGTTSPRVALMYYPFRQTAIKLLYGEAFRAPNAYELYYYDGSFSKPSPDLHPEKIRTYELVWEQYLNDSFRLTTVGYHYDIDDLISLQMDPADGFLVFRNIDKVQAEGFEAELEGKWPEGFEGRISYAFQEAKDEQTGRLLTNSPRHMAKLNVIVPLIKERLFLGPQLRYMSSRKTLADKETGDAFVADLTLFAQNLTKGLDASLSVYNLLGRKYGDPGSEEHVQDILFQDGRTFRFKVTYSF